MTKTLEDRTEVPHRGKFVETNANNLLLYIPIEFCQAFPHTGPFYNLPYFEIAGTPAF